jgi:uncharacterized membrane protein
MDEAPLTAMSALRFGMSKYSEDAGYCFGFLALVEIVCLLSAGSVAWHTVLLAQLIFQLDQAPPDSYLYVFLSAYLVIRTAAQAVINRWLLMMHDGRRITFDELFGFDFAYHMPTTIRLMGASFVYSLYGLLGSLLLLLPGLFFNAVLRYYRFLIIERDADAVQGLRESYELSGQFKGQLVVLSITSGLIKLGGICCFGIGYIPASAVCGLAEAYAYRQMMRAYEQDQPTTVVRGWAE